MLTLLKTWLTNNASNTTFSIKKLCDLEKSCCPNVQTKFFDFDKIKEWYCKEQECITISSVDALHIHDNSNSVYFVEMKGWKAFIEHNPKATDKAIIKQAAKFDFISKFEDSLSILNNIIRFNNFTPVLTKDQLIQFKKCLKHFILITDLDSVANPLQEIVATLSILSQTSSKVNFIHDSTNKALSKLNTIDYGYTNLQTPKRLNCSQVDHFFNNL